MEVESKYLSLFYRQDFPLFWREHYRFWQRKHDRKDWVIFFLEGAFWRKVGSVYITKLHQQIPEIGIYVGEVTLYKKGVATKALTHVFAWIQKNGYSVIQARIFKDNIGSLRLFERLGFRKDNPLRKDGWFLYHCRLQQNT
ncbi:MAG: hypothetical protein A3A65_02900 [Candidatus Chisholmbacteria bacterium RIFCSPLOWO2_01_FULL_49_14]|uniref:N-acetyltransferase domain-containing protein n=1 Tax=Candidatus Chisholmbacteria bacterium RIFCSPLOWO2_01_FULL_49_14 TaxID=1797593 RepID=A0A1G1W2Q7_9BACT|nr:MAG: hypothetical protein A3A65_02900 [Candidatus Chisholmbacteria bacterium RIFCSPLOWO2_01_FULL_49_14]